MEYINAKIFYKFLINYLTNEHYYDIILSQGKKPNTDDNTEENMKIVIYRENGVYKTTTEENYKRTIRNAREVCVMKDFLSADEIILYYTNFFYDKYNEEDFIVIDN